MLNNNTSEEYKITIKNVCSTNNIQKQTLYQIYLLLMKTLYQLKKRTWRM